MGRRTPATVTVGVVAVAAALSTAAMLGSELTGHGAWSAPGSFGAGGCLLLLGRMVARADRIDDEARIWPRMGLALAAVGVGLLVEGALRLAVDLEGLDGYALGIGAGLGTTVACGLLYTALVLWNTFRHNASEVGDGFAGLCSVLVFVAVGRMAIDVSGLTPISTWPVLQVDLLLAHVGAAMVLSAAALTVAAMGGRTRDRRLWVLSALFAAAAVAEAAATTTSDGRLSLAVVESVWTLVGCGVAVTSLMAPAPVQQRPTVSHTHVVGTLGLLAASVTILGVNGAPGLVPGRLSTAVLAIACSLVCAVRMLHMVRDLSSLAKSRQEARTDDLTGLSNRRALTGALTAAAAEGGPVALLVVDLDRFKQVNDRHGHAAGEEVLRVMSERLTGELPERSVLGRLGGDEFAVLLRGDGVARATEIAWALHDTAVEPVQVAGRQLRMGASIGVAANSADGAGDTTRDRADAADDVDLMRRADSAMYVAKRAGGGVSTYDEQADLRARREQERLDELHQVLGPDAREEHRQQIVVHYQPQLDVGTGCVVGAEALVRWQHPVHGLLYPDAFLGLVERDGLMLQLTAAVLRQAAAQAARWHRSGHELQIAVNLSTSCLAHPDLLAVVDDVLAGTGIDPTYVTLEITETTLMSDRKLALEVTHAIASRGIAISIDDFGTGYSSLAYLNDLPAEELKLDRTFTARVLTDPRTASIVAGTIDLAHHLGLRLVAEGVEDEETLAALAGLGCDQTQGYLHARPMTVELLDPWLAQRAHPDARPATRLAAS